MANIYRVSEKKLKELFALEPDINGLAPEKSSLVVSLGREPYEFRYIQGSCHRYSAEFHSKDGLFRLDLEFRGNGSEVYSFKEFSEQKKIR